VPSASATVSAVVVVPLGRAGSVKPGPVAVGGALPTATRQVA